MTGTIFSIKEMAVHDGPGIRTTVFLKGCPLRCRWCHNPEGLRREPQLLQKQARCRHCGLCDRPCTHPECRPYGKCLHICPENCLEVSGQEIDASELAQKLRRDAEPLGESFGGFTFSGGEPLWQPEFLMALLDALSDCHLCIETSGYADAEVFRQVLSRLDGVIMDVKLADAALHRKYTGVGNAKILENLHILQQSGKPHWLRTPMIPGITDTEENLEAIRRLVGDSPWECLPYNTMAGAKYPMLGMRFPMEEGEP